MHPVCVRVNVLPSGLLLGFDCLLHRQHLNQSLLALLLHLVCDNLLFENYDLLHITELVEHREQHVCVHWKFYIRDCHQQHA